MPLPSFLQRLRGKATSAPSEAEQPPLSASDVEAARVRARRRLIGMVVLVGAGIIGFPWLFETQPRPMSPDVQMVRGGDLAEGADVKHAEPGSKVALIQVPAEASSSGSEAAAPQEQVGEQVEGEEVLITTPPARATAASATELKTPVKPEVRPEPKSESRPKVEAKPEPKAQPKPEAKPGPKTDPKVESKPTKPADPDGTRFVVQFGAFSDGITAHEARMKVERLGIKTYTQEVKTPQGTRIRVRMGPYANRAEAEKVLSSLRKAGLSGAVLTL